MSRRLAAMLVLTLAVVGLSSAHALGAVITFDDINTSGPGGGGLVSVNSQYASQGVTFNNPSAIDYAKGSSALPGFAHSGTVAVEPCVATEFCSSPVTASFTTGQTSVKVWVGFSSALSQALPVRLTAFDAGNAVVGTADATLPVNVAATPDQTPLAVTAAGATIRQVQVSVPNQGYTSGVSVDDLEFSTAGPPPPCTATSVPVVNIAQPADNEVQNNEFLLQGTVANGGAPIESAAIVSQGSTTRSASLFPTLVPPGGGALGPIRFGGFLLPGGQKISVRATNCLGTGSSQTIIVAYRPIPDGTRFRQLGLEVTQGVQTSANSVPLIAAAANSSKRTFARAYLALTGGAPDLTNVSGTLTATRQDGTPAPGPTGVQSLNRVTVRAGAGLADLRRSLDASLNFELPSQWLAAGAVHLQLSHLSIESEPSALPCDGCDNPGPTGPALSRFHTTPPLRIELVSIPYLIPPDRQTVHEPTQSDFDHLVSWLKRAYPAADVQVTQTALGILPSPPGSCDDVNRTLSSFVGSLSPQADPRTRFYGLVSDNGNKNFMRGCAVIGGQVASGPAGSGSWGWDHDGSYADWYGGHEIGHTYGRLHPGYCRDESSDDSHYPYPNGYIGSGFFDVQGLDAGDSALNIPMSVDDPAAGWTDVMTYCNSEWMSDYTYRGILANLCAADHPNCPDHGLLAGDAVTAAALPAPRRRIARSGLSITGTLTTATGRLALDPMFTQRNLVLSTRPAASAYAIRLLGRGGQLLASYPFTPKTESDAPRNGAAKALIDEAVPFVPGTARIVITKASRALAAVRVSAHAPRVHVISPNGRRPLRGRVTVRWSSRDADGGRRWYTVLYSPDGRRVIPVAARLRGTSLKVNLATLPGGTRARFTVVATDGVLTGSDRSDRRFAVAPKPPRVTIAAPQGPAARPAGAPIAFVGSAVDPQDGQLPASRVVWLSSLQGELGHGAGITAVLRPGVHRITLRATDRAGLTRSATVTVTVADPPPPAVAAQLLP